MAAEDTTTVACWLRMLSEGGRWTTRELADAAALDPAALMAQLAAWAKAGYARRYEPGPEKGASVQFGVDADCRVPGGLKLRELEDALRCAGGLR